MTSLFKCPKTLTVTTLYNQESNYTIPFPKLTNDGIAKKDGTKTRLKPSQAAAQELLGFPCPLCLYVHSAPLGLLKAQNSKPWEDLKVSWTVDFPAILSTG